MVNFGQKVRGGWSGGKFHPERKTQPKRFALVRGFLWSVHFGLLNYIIVGTTGERGGCEVLLK
jgi:hypothetical protein